MKSFRDRSNETELSKLSKLSKYIWQLKDESKHLQHTLRNTCVSCALKCGTRHCDLYLTEKYIIARADQDYILSKRTEIILKYRHRNKYFLKNVK